MKKNRTLIELIAKIVFGVLLLVVLFLIALNSRYMQVGSGVFDKWDKRLYEFDTTEIPVVRNGKVI